MHLVVIPKTWAPVGKKGIHRNEEAGIHTIQSRLAGWPLDTPSKIFDYLQIASTITRRYFQDHHNAKRNAR